MAERVVIMGAAGRDFHVFNTGVHEAEEHLERGEFLAGSMAPKVMAGIEFLRYGGQQVLIGLPEELPALLQGETGTEIVPE